MKKNILKGFLVLGLASVCFTVGAAYQNQPMPNAAPPSSMSIADHSFQRWAKVTPNGTLATTTQIISRSGQSLMDVNPDGSLNVSVQSHGYSSGLNSGQVSKDLGYPRALTVCGMTSAADVQQTIQDPSANVWYYAMSLGGTVLQNAPAGPSCYALAPTRWIRNNSGSNSFVYEVSY